MDRGQDSQQRCLGTVRKKVKVKWSHVQFSVTPVDCSLLGSPSMGFSRQEYWSGSPFPSPGDLPNPGIEPSLLHCRQTLYRLSYQGCKLQPGGEESSFLTSPVLTPKGGVITAWAGGGGWKFQLPTCPPWHTIWGWPCQHWAMEEVLVPLSAPLTAPRRETGASGSSQGRAEVQAPPRPWLVWVAVGPQLFCNLWLG